MRLFLTFILFVIFCITASAKKTEITLAKIKLFKDLIEIKVPDHFTGLLDYEIKKFYKADNLPVTALGDSLRETRLAFYSRKNGYPDADVSALRASIQNDFLRDDLKMKELANGLFSSKSGDIAFIEILHKSPKKFYRFFFLLKYKTLVLSGELIAPKKGYKDWMPVAKEIMYSLHIKVD
jgi:hypothetical protein